MCEKDKDWMTYIDGEVRATCEVKGWRHQIRRKWSIREKPVSKSSLDDYEWKLMPKADDKLSDTQPEDYNGCYYILSFDKLNKKFILQHDTSHCGIAGPHFETATYTEIGPGPEALERIQRGDETPIDHTPVGWLRDHILNLTNRFEPNLFFNT